MALPEPGDAARLLQRLFANSRGASYVSSGVQARSDDVGGRGIFATRALSEGEELLRISHSALVTASTGQMYPDGQALRRLADDVEAGADWPPGVVVRAAPGETAPDFPNEETYTVLALVLEDAMRRRATPESDASILAVLANDGQDNAEFDQARRQIYYAALPTLEELRKTHPLFMVPDIEPEPEQPPPLQLLKRAASSVMPAAVRAAVANCGLSVGEGTAESVAVEYWSAIVSMHQTVASEYHSLCTILGEDFAKSHSADEWLYCWAMVMSRNFLLQIGDPIFGGALLVRI